MKITFYSNYLTHHQLPFCKEMYKYLGNNFIFCADQKTPKYRLDCGWENLNDKYPFVLKKYENKANIKIALELADSSDVIILGDSSDSYRKIRIRNKKFFFRETERLFKSRIPFRKRIKIYFLNWKYFRKEKNSYLLSIGPYTYYDFASILCYRNRGLKFGYFPTLPKINIEKVLDTKIKNSFIWIGRFIEFKHPEYVVKLAKKFKNIGKHFTITMVGDGRLFEKIKNDIQIYKLESYIKLIGSINFKDVHSYFARAQFHLFTSDRNEGWGAVLNESMNSGCIPIANKQIGSAAFLIKHMKNGIIYKKSYNSFEKNVFNALNLDDNFKFKMAIKAFETINVEWNAKEATKEIIRISENKLKNVSIKFKNSGVMSKIKNKLF